MMRELPYLEALPEARGARDAMAAALRASSAALDRLAGALARKRPAVRGEPVLEFYAEAGAPEGALYLDGELVGRIEGVTRL